MAPAFRGADGQYLPWLPYPVIRLLNDRVPPTASVLELGSGYGSLFWAARQRGRFVTVESDVAWAYKIHTLGAELGIDVQPIDPDDIDGTFDLVIVDGKDRPQECGIAMKHLAPKGCVLVDDTHRTKEFLEADKLRRWYFDGALYLEGLGPGSTRLHGTTILYMKRGNLLGL